MTIEAAPGPLNVLARASNRAGQSQIARAVANPAGYHHNAYSSVSLTVI